MRTPPIVLFALLAAPLWLSCSPLFYAEMDEDSFCVTLLSQTLPGAAGASGAVDQTLEYDLGENLSILDDEALVERSVRFLSMHITTAGIDLSGTSHILVAAQPGAGSTHPAVDIVDIPIPATGGQVSQIDAAANDQVELVPYLFEGAKLTFSLHLEGTLPAQPWSADVKACLRARVKVDVIKAVQ